MSVRLAPGNQRHSSTKNLMQQNGLLEAIKDGGGEPHFFDDADFDHGYVEADLPPNSSWSAPPMIARVVTEVDHIVYLPRLAAHCLTGYTHGHKLSVGWMRDDTRHQMHFDAGTLYEKYTEVSYCEQIRSRLRLVLTAVERVMVEGGPDDGGEALADPAIVLASEHLATHDAIAVQVLAWARAHLPREGGDAAVPFGPWAGMSNAGLLVATPAQSGIPWTSVGAWPSSYLPHDFESGVWSDRCLLRAYEILGGVPSGIALTVLDDDVPETLGRRLHRAQAIRV
jgi:hypothetical protein